MGRSILPAQEAGDSRSCLYWNSPYFPHYHRIPPQTAILLLFKVPFVFNNPIRYNPLSYRERLSVIMQLCCYELIQIQTLINCTVNYGLIGFLRTVHLSNKWNREYYKYTLWSCKFKNPWPQMFTTCVKQIFHWVKSIDKIPYKHTPSHLCDS